MLTTFSLILLFAYFIIHILYRPDIDFTRDGDVILWYGRENRNYIFIFKNN